MALLNGTFDAGSVEPAKPFEPLPAGKYRAQIVESEMAATRAGDGQMLKLTLEILDGPHAHRKLWDQLNLVNPNQQTMEIAQRTLSAICHATGRLQVQDSAELHLIPMIADVTVKPPKNGYGESNKVHYLPLERGAAATAAKPRPAAPAAAAPAAQPARPVAPAGGFANAPWKR